MITNELFSNEDMRKLEFDAIIEMLIAQKNELTKKIAPLEKDSVELKNKMNGFSDIIQQRKAPHIRAMEISDYGSYSYNNAKSRVNSLDAEDGSMRNELNSAISMINNQINPLKAKIRTVDSSIEFAVNVKEIISLQLKNLRWTTELIKKCDNSLHSIYPTELVALYGVIKCEIIVLEEYKQFQKKLKDEEIERKRIADDREAAERIERERIAIEREAAERIERERKKEEEYNNLVNKMNYANSENIYKELVQKFCDLGYRDSTDLADKCYKKYLELDNIRTYLENKRKKQIDIIEKIVFVCVGIIFLLFWVLYWVNQFD
jgi:hypothetical protein